MTEKDGEGQKTVNAKIHHIQERHLKNVPVCGKVRPVTIKHLERLIHDET